MGTTLQRNKNRTRPSKSAGARAKRSKVQRRRLIALGMAEADVALLNDKEVREKLKYPAKVVKELAAQDS